MMPDTNTIRIEAYGRHYDYDLGKSEPAKEAVRAYASWLQHRDHDHVLPVFANLSYVIDADPAKGSQATKATHILASIIYNKDKDPYRSFYLATCITSVYAKRSEKVPEVWLKAQRQAIQEIYGPDNNPNNFDVTRALKAGLTLLPVNK